jgi:hypothetical protein
MRLPWRLTPSHVLTREQSAQIRSVTTKSGALKFEFHDKLAALAQLAKVLGVAPEPQSQTVNNTQVNVGQVNVGQHKTLEGLRQLAFAIELAARRREADTRLIDGKVSEEPQESASPQTGNADNESHAGVSSHFPEIAPRADLFPTDDDEDRHAADAERKG